MLYKFKIQNVTVIKADNNKKKTQQENEKDGENPENIQVNKMRFCLVLTKLTKLEELWPVFCALQVGV